MGLSAEELRAIGDQLAAGRKPRVQFTEAAGQVAGQLGQVVGLADPGVAEECVVVRFGRDELPFSPGDLRIAPRGAAPRTAGARTAAVVAGPAPPEFVIDKPVRPAKRRSATAARSSQPPVRPPDGDGRARAAVPSRSPVAPPVRDGAAPSRGGRRTQARPPEGDDRSRPPQGRPPEVEGPVREAAPRGPARVKVPASLTVTLAYAGSTWTLSAAQGSKVLARPSVIGPAQALRLVSTVDVPAVREAVEQILAVERTQVQERARRLRTELAEVEARLTELGQAP